MAAYDRAVRMNAPLVAALIAKRGGLPRELWLEDAFKAYCRLCDLGFEEEADAFARELGLTVVEVVVNPTDDPSRLN